MYSLVSSYPIARCKKYFQTLEELKAFLPNLITATNKYRAKEHEKKRLNLQTPVKVTESEMIHSIRIYKINTEAKDYSPTFIGSESDINFEFSPKE